MMIEQVYNPHRLFGRFNINAIKRIFIEPGFNRCNLRCLHCPVGLGVKLRDTPTGMMPLGVFRRICEKSLRRFTGEMALYNWGEPFSIPTCRKWSATRRALPRPLDPQF